jgi:polyisoprenoid-binding protein YceI
MRFAAIALSLCAPSLSQAGVWTIDASHTHVGFAVKHLSVSTVRGEFGKVSGTLDLNDADPTKSTISVTIETASIDTREPKRDDHLRSADFFDAAKYPQITFKSTGITKAGAGYKVAGTLTMRGVTKPVTLDVSTVSPEVATTWGHSVRGFSATAKINRKDFGVNWNSPIGKTGGLVVGEEVTITLDVEATNKK